MKLLQLLTLALIVTLAFPVNAAKQPTWTAAIEGSPIAIFTHSFTGIPVVETSTHYYGMNYVDHSILWSVAKPTGAAALATAAQVGTMTGATSATAPDYFQEIPMTPFVSINKRFADVSTGKVLFGEGEDAYTSIIGQDIIPSIFKLLVKVRAPGGSVILYCVDLHSKTVDWKTTLEIGSVKGEAMKMAKSKMSLSAKNVFAPKTISNNNIVYKNGSDLFLFDYKTGNTIWKNTCRPGTFFLNDSEEYLIVAEQASGASAYMSSGGAAFGKSIFAIDLESGELAWKEEVKLDDKFMMQSNFDADNFIVATRKGINIYDYKTGTQRWKKNFEANRIHDVNVASDGIELFYGNKFMLVDVKTGKKAWKKPIEYKDVPEDEEAAMVKKEYAKGTFIMGGSFVGLFDKVTGKKIWATGISDDSKVAFDERNNKVAIIDGKKFYLFDPNTVVKKPAKIKLDINEPDELIGFETRADGYFITGMDEYIMLNKDATVAASAYFKPLKTDRLLKAALTTTAIAAGAMSTEVSVTDAEGNEVYSGGAFTSTENARAFGEVSDAQFDAIRKLKEDAKLGTAAVSTKNHVFFLKGTKGEQGDEMSIVKVEKDSGKEVDSFDFGDDRKVIYQLDKFTNQLYFLDETEVKVFDLN